MRLASARGFSEYRDRILNGPILRTMLWLAWPIIVANIVNMSYNLIDAFWLGKIGKEAFGAPTVSWPMIMLFYSIGFGYVSAGIALVSQYLGAGEKVMAEKSASMLMFFSLFVALAMSIAGILGSPVILMLMGVPKDIYPLAVSYTFVIFAGIPVTFTGFVFNIIANSIGDTRTPTFFNIVSVIANIVLDPIMIFGWFGFPRLGVVGAALATVLSRTIVAGAGVYYLFYRGFHGIKIRREYMGIERWWLKKILHIGTPLAIQRSGNSLGFTVMTSFVSRFGSTVVAAYGIAIRVIDVIQAFTWGLMRATSIMVGQNIGAENYGRSREIARTALTYTFVVLLIGAVFIYAWRTQLISFFINDPDVIAEGSRLIEVFVWSIPFFGVFFIGGAIASGSGHTRVFAGISILRLWGLRIGFSIILAFIMGMGPMGIWVAMTISNLVAGILTLYWISMGTWLKRVIQIPAQPPTTGGLVGEKREK